MMRRRRTVLAAVLASAALTALPATAHPAVQPSSPVPRPAAAPPAVAVPAGAGVGLEQPTSPESNTPEPRSAERLGTLAEHVVDSGVPGAIVARRTSESGLVAVARGKADTSSGRPARAGDRYRIGSMTKPMVAVVVLQLVEEGTVGLDDSVAGLLPKLGLDPRITVRHLLLQTSGLHRDTMVISPPRSYEANRFRYFRPAELVEIALTNPDPRAEPGTRHEYSNTNYVLAGMVIEKVTGHSVGHELRRRIFRPLEMRDTSFPRFNPVIFGRHLRGYLGPKVQRDLGVAEPEKPLLDTTVYSMSWAWTSGAVISTAEDQITFLRALFNDRLLSPDMLGTMLTPGPDGVYAMGLVKIEVPCAPGGVVWGHDGMVYGYGGAMFSTPDGRVQSAAIGNAWLYNENGGLNMTATQVALAATCPAAR